MRIGILLRHYEQHEGGVKVYTQNLLPHLFSLGSQHYYVLIYQNPKLRGMYAQFPHVEEIAVAIPGTVLWDQLAVPWVAKRYRLDLLFNPKFTVPIFSRAKKVFVLHGSEWFVIPDHFLPYDRLYFRLAVPVYCRRADAIIAVSKAVKADVTKYLGISANKVLAIHNGFDPHLFQPVRDARHLQTVREKYRLPEKFIFWAGQIESRKNIARLLRAFARLQNDFPHQLVLAGEQRWSATAELRPMRELGIENRVLFPGWVSHDDLPALYTLATLFVFPSLHEGFGIPLLEAMACGCPIVTATTCAPPEVTDGAAYLVDPLSIDEIAAGMRKVLMNSALRHTMISQGFARVANFGWDKTAAQVLALCDSLCS